MKCSEEATLYIAKCLLENCKSSQKEYFKIIFTFFIYHPDRPGLRVGGPTAIYLCPLPWLLRLP